MVSFYLLGYLKVTQIRRTVYVECPVSRCAVYVTKLLDTHPEVGQIRPLDAPMPLRKFQACRDEQLRDSRPALTTRDPTTATLLFV
jgi:hypothetical protein